MAAAQPPSPDGDTRGSDYRSGWEAAISEIEHQAEHWATPDHGEVGILIAQALRAATEIARGGGLACEHRMPVEQ